MAPRHLLRAAGVAGAFTLTGMIIFDPPHRPETERGLVVLAASSLSGVLRGDEQTLDAEISFAASGMHYHAVSHGRPFDVLITASAEHADRLVNAGVARAAYPLESSSPVLVTPNSALIDDPEEWLSHHPRVRIAIPNPEHAPFGASAADWLRDRGIDYRRDGRFVVAQSVESAMALLARGAVDAACGSDTLNPSGTQLMPLPGARPIRYWAAISQDSTAEASKTASMLSLAIGRTEIAQAERQGE